MAGPIIDVFMTRDHVVLKNDAYSLWCGRKDGKLMPGTEVHTTGLDSPVLLGQVWGCIGKIRFFSDADWKLLLIRHASSVGEMPRGENIYCIERIAVLPLTTDPSVEYMGLETPGTSDPGGLRPHSPALGKTRSTRASKEKNKELKDKEKLERRLTEALLWMFNESRSFYFCPEGDLTQVMQRQLANTELQQLPHWQRVDDRFFWNKKMLDDLLGDNYAGPLADPWILPVVQGYVEIRQIPVQRLETPDTLQTWKPLQEGENRRKNSELQSQASTWGGYEMVELHEETRPSSTELDSLDQPDTVGERGGATSTSEVAPPEELDWYESDAESCKSRDTDDILDGYYGRLYACKEQLEEEEAREREKTREEREATEGREKERANGGGDDSGDEGSEDALVCEVGGTRGESVAMEDGGSKGVSMLEDETKEGVELGDKGSEGAGMQGQRYEPEEGIETEPSDRENLDHGSHFDQTSTLLSTEEHTECNHDHTATEPTMSSSIQEHHQDHHENQDQEQGLNQNGAIPSGIPVTPDLSVAVKENGQQYVGALDEESVHDISTEAAEINAPTPVVQNSEKSTNDGDKEALDGSDLHRDDIELAALSGDEDMEPAVNGLMTADKDGEVSCGYEKESATLGGDKDFRSQEGVTASNEGEDSGIESTLRLVGNEKEEEMFHRTLLEDPGEESELPAEEGVSPQLGDKKEATDFGVHLGQQKDYISPAVSSDEEEEEPEDTPTFTLVIISRRSRHRAGTRYRRRGVDKEGYVANYVETEMLIQAGAHQVSYVIVRGSVPVYWTQLGYKYRPPPIIEKGEEETQEAFREHFEQQLNLYKKMAIVNLVNQTGREGVLAEAYEKQILLLDNPLLTFVAFDFHRQYKLHGATPLLKATEDIKRRQKFCWLNTELGEDPLCMQEGVFRVNCMDCLDRTNVIQSLLCRQVLQTTLHKLGVLPFEEKLGESTLREYQEMWANNGDIISRQYTGTRAMKGDLTRYGERKFYGMMKDGYNSAHRYYQNVFRDAYRQVLIDLMQGYSPSEAFASLSPSMRMLDEDIPAIIPITAVEVDDSELWSLDREQAIADMIQQCKYELFADKSLHIQGWAVMEAAGYSFVESSQKEEACVLLQCREKSQLCVANYNSEIDQVICFIRIPMEKIEKIVIGSLGTLLRSSKRLHMRIYYSLVEDKTCYFTFKTVNFTSVEDDKAILSGIATALSYIQPSITVHEQKLTKKRSPDHEGVAYLVMPDEWREWAELEPPVEDNKAPLSHNSKMTEKTGSTTTHTAEKKANLAARIIDDQIEQDLEDEQEISFSAPSSPKLIRRHPLQLHKRTRSQSFDDILSCVNNEVIPPASINSQIIPRSPAKKSSVLQPLYDSDSGSESDVETYKVSTTGRTASESDLRGSQKELEDSESGQRSQTSAFTRFKGRFLQKMKFGAQKQQYLSSSSVTSQEAEDSDAQTIPQVTQTMAQKFRNSPGLLRKVGVNRKNKLPQPPQPSEEDIKRKEARERSQTRFLLI